MTVLRRLPVSKVQPDPRNPRKPLNPSDPEYRALVRSLDEYGNVQPLVWNQRDGMLIAGHQRFTILVARGETHVDAVVVDLPREKASALGIALNKISGHWDEEKLSALLAELVTCPELDVTITGFDLPEIQHLVDADPRENHPPGREAYDVEAALDAQQGMEPVTRPGDIILLGTNLECQHRLMCGDSTDPTQVQRLMDGTRAALCATDPPYLVGYTGANRPKARRNGNKAPSADLPTWDDPTQVDLYERYLAAAIAEALLPDAALYVWHASRRQAMLEAALTKNDILVHQQIIWNKPNAVPGRSWYRWRHEPCFYGWRKGKKPKRFEKDEHSTVWDVEPIGRGTSERPDHPTPKPVLLFEIPMRQHTKPATAGGELANCYEPFAGSGTQIIAAERLRRRCFAMELDPKYCDLIVRRFIAYVGEHSVNPEIADKYRLRTTDGVTA